jgi:hypothetical protein
MFKARREAGLFIRERWVDSAYARAAEAVEPGRKARGAGFATGLAGCNLSPVTCNLPVPL